MLPLLLLLLLLLLPAATGRTVTPNPPSLEGAGGVTRDRMRRRLTVAGGT